MIGLTLGHYRILGKIGAGGMGEVYRSRDEHLSRDVAIKILPAGLLADESARKRFRKEADAFSRLNHPNIATIHDFDTQDGVDFLVMEYVPGTTLSEKVAAGPLPEKELLRLGTQLAEGLAAAHEQGVVHRDLKPGNVQLTPEGRLKILDFGLARLLQAERASDATQTLTQSSEVMAGTLPYMAPEQLRGEPADARTDIYALGALLYEMATGQRPFQAKLATALAADIQTKSPAAPRQLQPKLSSRLEDIILKCLEKDPENRYQSAKELMVDLRRVASPSTTTPLVPARRFGRRKAVVAVSIAAVMLAVVLVGLNVGGVRERLLGRTRPSEAAAMRVVPVTSLPGVERDPSFSPDGNSVAFAWNGGTGNNFDIYIKQIGSETTLRLTDNPAEDCCPAWSPDGRYIAFIRISETERGIHLIPALGGAERKIRSLTAAVTAELAIRPWWAFSFLRWSPDGRLLAFSDRSSEKEPYAIFLLTVENLETQQLTAPPAQHVGDGWPVVSPDGNSLAFVRIASSAVTDIYVVPVSRGEPRRLTFENSLIVGLDWTPDGREIVFSSYRAGSPSLWRIPASGGQPKPLTVGGGGAIKPTISHPGGRLAYEQPTFDTDIWQMEVHSLSGRAPPPTKFVSSTREELGPQFSPDGKRITFCSDRSGTREIWVCQNGASNCSQLTSFNGPNTCTPRWAPDSRQIALDSRPEGHSDIYLIDVERRLPRRLTTEASDDVVPSWSRNGRWVYFTSNRSGTWQVWKMPAEGAGSAVQVTKHGGFAAFDSPDGRFVYFAKFQEPGIWRVPVEGGEERLVFDQLRPGLWGYWAVADKGIYFLNSAAKPRPAIQFFRFADRRISTVAPLEGEPSLGEPGLSVSPDGRWILYVQSQPQGDIMLLENFR